MLCVSLFGQCLRFPDESDLVMVGGAYVTLVLIPTEISVFGHDSIVWIMGWRDLVPAALTVWGGGGFGFF